MALASQNAIAVNTKDIQRCWNEAEIAKDYETLMRANDGVVDCQGRFWVGAMNDPAYTNAEI